MLPINAFSTGTLESIKANSLLLYRDEPVLVLGNPSYAITTDQWRAFRSNGNTAWRGVAIQGIRIEVDPTTRFDEGRVRYSPGDLIVRGDNAYVAATLDDGWHTSILVGIDGDAIGDEGSNRGYGFKRWNVVTGTGTEKVVLAEVTDQTVALKI